MNNKQWFLVEVPSCGNEKYHGRRVVQGKDAVSQIISPVIKAHAYKYDPAVERARARDKANMGAWMESEFVGNPGLYCADIYPVPDPEPAK